MANVEPLSEEIIERALKETGLHYLKDADGDFRVGFARDDDSGRELTAWVVRQGTQQHILVNRVFADQKFAKADFAKVIMACNSWNSTRRWPNAFLYADGGDLNTASDAQIILEFQVDCGKGIHLELVQDMCATTIACAHEFWEWAHKEQHLC